MINDHAFQGERSRTHAHKFTIRSHLPIIPVYYLSAYYSKNYASIICQPLPMNHACILIILEPLLEELWKGVEMATPELCVLPFCVQPLIYQLQENCVDLLDMVH